MSAEYSIQEMCEAMEVSRSGYYQWVEAKPGIRAQENQMLVERMLEIHEEHRARYGSPRMTRVLRSRGFSCGENWVARLMSVHKIRARRKRGFRPRTTDKGPRIAPFILPDIRRLLDPNRVWVSDITYIPTRQGWLYLA